MRESELDLGQYTSQASSHDGGMVLHPSPLPAHIDEILVVAPTDALRASVRFLLEEESYRVSTVASISEAATLTTAFACAVIDHHALRVTPAQELGAFIGAHWPVVLLANGTAEELPESFRVVTKPLLGAALSQAVREAVALSRGGR